MDLHNLYDGLRRAEMPETGKILDSHGNGYLLAWGPTVPVDASVGYAPGCIFIDTNAAAGTVYINGGTKASSDFNLSIQQVAGAAQAAVVLGNTNDEIGGLAISDPPTEAEVEALRDKTEELADDVRAMWTLQNAIRDALITNGIIKGGA